MAIVPTLFFVGVSSGVCGDLGREALHMGRVLCLFDVSLFWVGVKKAKTWAGIMAGFILKAFSIFVLKRNIVGGVS